MKIYWGACNSGKAHLKMLFRADCKPQLEFTNDGYHALKLDYVDGNEHEVFYYSDGKIQSEVRRKNTTLDDKLTYNYGERYNYVDNRPPLVRTKYGNNKNRKVSNYSPIFLSQNWEHLIDEWYNCELMITPYPLIGIASQEHCITRYRTKPTDKCLSLVKSATNIVPYKSNLLDSMISKLSLFDKIESAKKSKRLTGRFVVFKDLSDVYNKHKEMLWHHLDGILEEHREIEYRLRQLDIPYQYFDLDNDSYDIFECTNILPSTYTHPDWDLTDSKTHSNWTILRDIAEEYIELRNLHDMRLDATITGII